MRRLLRWTFHALAAASLLLCLATAGLWVRSYWVNDEFTGQSERASKYGGYRYLVLSSRGQLGGWFYWSECPELQPPLSWEFILDLDRRSEFFERGWTFLSRRGLYEGYEYSIRYWNVPAWSLVSAFAVLPSIVLFRQVRAVRRRRHRSRLGLCPACGYDLRATPGRCPECGRQS